MPLHLEPQRGVTLTIDDEVISDEAVVYANGSRATAYVWSPEAGENEVVAVLVEADLDSDGKLVGRIFQPDEETGEPGPDDGNQSIWVITPGRGCKHC